MENLSQEHHFTVAQHPAFEFAGWTGNRATADLTVIHRDGIDMPVVIATEREDNDGVSVTNGAEWLAAAVLSKVFPERAREIEPFLFVVHHPAKSFDVGDGNFEGLEPGFEQVRFADFYLRGGAGSVPRVGHVLSCDKLRDGLCEMVESAIAQTRALLRNPDLAADARVQVQHIASVREYIDWWSDGPGSPAALDRHMEDMEHPDYDHLPEWGLDDDPVHLGWMRRHEEVLRPLCDAMMAKLQTLESAGVDVFPISKGQTATEALDAALAQVQERGKEVQPPSDDRRIEQMYEARLARDAGNIADWATWQAETYAAIEHELDFGQESASSRAQEHDRVVAAECDAVRAYMRDVEASPEWALAGRLETAPRAGEVALPVEALAQVQPAPYRSHDAPRAVEIGEIRQAKATSITGRDGKAYRLEAGRYAVVADETRDGRLQSAMLRYIVTDPTSGECHAALSPVSDDRLRALVRDGSVQLHQGFTIGRFCDRQEVARLHVERQKRQQVEPAATKVALRR